jgi:hypothetical protein
MRKAQLKKIGLIASLLIMVLQGSCTQTPTSTADPTKFFDITYIVTESSVDEVNWTPVQGKFEILFNQSQVDQEFDGNYTLHYTSYLEPQLCPFNENCVCSGGDAGTFIQDTTATPAPAASGVPYNPLTPYVPTGTSAGTVDPTSVIDPTTGLPTVASIDVFFFDITIAELNLSSGCHPETNRTLMILRFSDGNLIMQDDYRYLYLVPEVTN